MKFCKDCKYCSYEPKKWYQFWRYGPFENTYNKLMFAKCLHPNALLKSKNYIDPVTGERAGYDSFSYCDTMRTKSLQKCDVEAYWFEPREQK